MELNAATRLRAAKWWDALPDELKKDYIEEHPNSKYAKEYRSKGEGESEEAPKESDKNQLVKRPTPPVVKEKPKKEVKDVTDVKDKQQVLEGPNKHLTKDEIHKRMKEGRPGSLKSKRHEVSREVKTKLKQIPRASAEFAQKVFDNPLGEEVKYQTKLAARDVKRAAQGLWKDTKSAASATSGAAKLLTGRKPSSSEWKGLGKTLFNVATAVAVGSTLGLAAGPALLVWGAAKYFIAPFLKDLARTGLDAVERKIRGPGVWHENGKFIPLTQHEYDNLSDEDFERMRTAATDDPKQAMLNLLLKYTAANMTPEAMEKAVMDSKSEDL